MKYILYYMFAFLLPLNVAAQKFVASASKNKVAVGEQFQIAFSLNTDGAGFRAPALHDFDVYSGPNQSTSMQFINGNMSQSISFSFIIAAKKEGRFTIGPASITVNGSKLESNPLVIDVVKGSSVPQHSSSEPRTAQANGELFAKTAVSKTKAYQGEQIVITHKIYTQLNIRGFQDIKFPTYNGFWSQDQPQNSQINLSSENINGSLYYVAEVKKTFLFPQRTGVIEIGPAEFQCIVRQPSNKRPQSIFDQFFGGGYEDVIYNTKSKPVKIEVLNLPEANKPEHFSGAVGNYSFKATIDKEKVEANQAVNLTVTVSGKGNLKLIEPLKIKFPDDVETYEPKINNNISVTGGGVTGNKTYEYLIIPRHPGDYKIGPIDFSYFDPEKKSYITIPSPEFSISVDKASDSGAPVTSGMSKEDVRLLTSDIRYIKTGNIRLQPKENYFFGSPAFIAGVTTPLVLFFSFLLIRRKYITDNSDLVQVRSRKATSMAKKRLVHADRHLKSNNKEAFYDEIFRALYGYLSDKLTIPVAELSKDTVVSVLHQRGTSTDTTNQLINTLNQCEFVRYAPAAASGNLQGIYQDTVQLITKLENEIKK